MTRKRILIVEDERIIALDLAMQLRGLGYDICQTVATGEAAIAETLNQKPDLVLMDIHLAGEMDGIEAATCISQQSDVPIVFLTAYADGNVLDRAEPVFPYGYLVKPVLLAELHATIRMALARSGYLRREGEYQQQLEQALRNADLSVWEVDPHHQQMQLIRLDMAEASQGRDVESLDIASFLKAVSPESRAAVREAIDRLKLPHETQIQLSFQMQAAHEVPRWYELRGRRVQNLHDLRERVIGVLQDVTQRRAAEDRLSQAMAVFNSTSEGIFILDTSRRVTLINPAFTVLTGYELSEAAEWLGADLLYLNPHSDSFYSQLEKATPNQWQGQSEYLCKNGQILPVWETLNAIRDSTGKITHYVVVFADITSMLEFQEKLDFQAKHDALTGLCNRRLFQDRLAVELGKSVRHNRLSVILLIDLDHFKTINDTLGHAVGDELLKEAASRLLASVRATDTVARLGGDEFVVLLGDIEEQSSIDQLAKILLDKLSQPFQLGQEKGYISASIGIAMAPVDGVDGDDLLKKADQAMYDAKRRGRGTFAYYEPIMQKAAELRHQIHSNLHDALHESQFWLAYQPIVDISTGAIVKAEVLLRWTHPVHGEISPANFIPIAEETGFILELGNWIFQQVMQDLTAWKDTPLSQVRIGINLSAHQLKYTRTLTSMLEQLPEQGIQPSQLILEITEGVLLEDRQNTREFLAFCQQQGVTIALDDFGTGYSALGYLNRFPIDILKIDRSFVEHIHSRPKDHALCEAIASLAHKLGMRVVAEGVENVDQLERLRAMDCDYAQGFYYYRPMPARDFAALVNGGRVQLVAPNLKKSPPAQPGGEEPT